MTWSIVDMLVPVLAFAHQLTDLLNNHFVVDMVIISADDIRLAERAFF